MWSGSLDHDYRNPTKFNALLQRLRSDPNIRRRKTENNENDYTGSNSNSNENHHHHNSKDDDGITDNDIPKTAISDILFLNDPSTEDDNAAGALGEALQVQLQNVSLLSQNETDVEVVHHLEMEIQMLTDDFDKYQSLLQYLTLAVRNHHRHGNPYLESIVIHGDGDHIHHFQFRHMITRANYIRARTTAAFLHALLPSASLPSSLSLPHQVVQTTTNSTTTTIMPRTLGLQQLSLYGCTALSVQTFITFIQRMTIPTLEMDGAMFGRIPPEPEQAAALARAFAHNTTLREFNVQFNRRFLPWITAILTHPQLRNKNTTLRILRLEWEIFPPSYRSHYNNDHVADPVVMEFVRALAQYLAETSSLQQVEFIDFGFTCPDILQLLLTSISSNPSIQVLSFHKCRWNESNWYDVLAPQFRTLRHVRRFEVTFGGGNDQNHTVRIPHLIQNILPSNRFIQQVCILPKQLVGGMLVLDEERKSCLSSYLQRNRGLQQFIKQYAKCESHCATVTLLEPKTESEDTVDHDDDSPDIFDVTNYINHYSFHIHETLQVAMRKQRRRDHQYHNVQRRFRKSSCSHHTDLHDTNGIQKRHHHNGPHPPDHPQKIPMALVPTILAHHFQPSSNPYGPTIIYQMFSNMGHLHFD